MSRKGFCVNIRHRGVCLTLHPTVPPLIPAQAKQSRGHPGPFIVPRWAAIHPGQTRAACSHRDPYGRRWVWHGAGSGGGSTSWQRHPVRGGIAMSRAILVVGAGGPRTRTSWDQILAGPILRSLKSEIDSASAESRVLGSPLARTSARSRFTPPLHPDHKMVLVMDGEASTSAHVGGPQLSTSPGGRLTALILCLSLMHACCAEGNTSTWGTVRSGPLPYGPSTVPLGMCTEKKRKHGHTKTCTQTFPAALFKITKAHALMKG